MNMILILLALIAFIILATTKFRLHPFLALIIAAFLGGFFYALPASEITKTITAGFGGVLGRIGPVIALSTIIGVTLERNGAMTVSHANDSFFRVVSRFIRMPVGLACRAFSMATLVQGITAMLVVYLFSLVLL